MTFLLADTFTDPKIRVHSCPFVVQNTFNTFPLRPFASIRGSKILAFLP